MEVKTGVLKNKLSYYLRQVRESGESIIVLDRQTPVAEIRPYYTERELTPPSVWELRRKQEVDQGAFSEDFSLPKRKTAKRKYDNPLD